MTYNKTINEGIPTLTGIRFLFASCVVLLHTQIYTNWLDQAPLIRDGIVMSGAAGVNFFFVLSGFILTYAMCTTLSGTRSKRTFYLTRFARIYPVYALGLIASIPIVVCLGFDSKIVPEGIGNKILSLSSHAILMQGWLPEYVLKWNPTGWSLSAETFFYALFPFIAPLILRQNTRTTSIIAIVSYCVSLAFPLICHGLNLVDMYVPGSGTAFMNVNLYFFFPLIRLPEFLLGMAAAGLFLKEMHFFKRHASFFLWVGFIGILIGLQIGGALIPLLMMTNGALGIFAVFLILGLSGATKSSLSDLLGRKVMVHLGHASYALYVIHLPALFLYVALLPENYNKIAALSIYLFGVTLLSVGIYHFYERPLQHLILKKLKGPEPNPSSNPA
jgi:peptidoglycan/LPS O-acetylase OafA/YrhL